MEVYIVTVTKYNVFPFMCIYIFPDVLFVCLIDRLQMVVIEPFVLLNTSQETFISDFLEIMKHTLLDFKNMTEICFLTIRLIVAEADSV